MLSFLNESDKQRSGLRISSLHESGKAPCFLYLIFYESREIQYVKCHMTGRSVSVNEGAEASRYGIASATALRWIFDYPFLRSFFIAQNQPPAGMTEISRTKTDRWK